MPVPGRPADPTLTLRSATTACHQEGPFERTQEWPWRNIAVHLMIGTGVPPFLPANTGAPNSNKTRAYGMRYFVKRYHPPGTSPGTLTAPKIAGAPPLRITLIDYTDQDFFETELVSAGECRTYLERPTNTWIHVQGSAEPETLKELGRMFGLHPLALEDVVNTGQRPKFETFDEHLFVIMSCPTSDEDKIFTEQISFFIGQNFLISFHEGAVDSFEPVRKRLRNHIGRIRGKKVDYLLYALLDLIIDQGFPVLEDIGERMEMLEEALMDTPTKETLNEIHRIRRELLLLRRMLWPQREVLNQLFREEHSLFEHDTMPYLRDCYDHTIQVMDLIETFREMTASMLDVYLSGVSNRLNEIMRVLTLIATIFIPLTFVVGVYGMNFGNNQHSPWAMPELNWYYGYPLIWAVMLVIAAGMVFYFKKKGWLR